MEKTLSPKPKQLNQPLNRKKLGQTGELIIKKYLLNKNWYFLSQNYHSHFGEIDLIFLSPNKTVVFVEVKSRTNNNSGHPEESINPTKLSRIRKTAQNFVLDNPQYQNYLFRIDVAAIENLNSPKPVIRYYQNVY